MPQQALVDGLGYELRPASEEELLRGLTEIDTAARDRGEPVMATLVADADAEAPPNLGIGLGAEYSVLVYDAGGHRGEGGFSKGPRTDDMTEVSLRYGTGHSEYLGWMLIPMNQAVEAAREFFHTGAQPAAVEWRDI